MKELLMMLAAGFLIWAIAQKESTPYGKWRDGISSRVTATATMPRGNEGYAGGSSTKTKKKPIQLKNLDQEAIQCILDAEEKLKVPGYSQFHTWDVESSCSTKPWGDKWVLAAANKGADSTCVAFRMKNSKKWDDRKKILVDGKMVPQGDYYTAEEIWKSAYDFCEKERETLKMICAVKDAQGKKTCNFNEVRTSPTFAIGQMQIQPSNLFGIVEKEVSKNGRVIKPAKYDWKPAAKMADADHDGSFEPFNVCEAIFASAIFAKAIQIENKYGTDFNGWANVTQEYLGERNPKRVAALKRAKDIWCAEKNCEEAPGKLASL